MSEGTGLYPDALIPDVDVFDGQKRNAFPVSVRSGEVAVIWMDIFVAATQDAGNFSATARVVDADGAVLAEQQLTIEVFGFALPSVPSLRSLFGLWPLTKLTLAHNLSSDCCEPCFGVMVCCCPTNRAVQAIARKYILAGLQNRVSIGALDTLGMPLPSMAPDARLERWR